MLLIGWRVLLSENMAWPADYHMHTPLCHHAVGEPTQYAAQAVKLGLLEIGFSEHSPMPRDDFDDWRMLLGDLKQYVEMVEKARRDHPRLKIRIALEVDYLPGHEEWIRELAARHPWDYLIGAVHYVSDSWDLDNPKKISEWNQRDPFEVANVGLDSLIVAFARYGVYVKQPQCEVFAHQRDDLRSDSAAGACD